MAKRAASTKKSSPAASPSKAPSSPKASPAKSPKAKASPAKKAASTKKKASSTKKAKTSSSSSSAASKGPKYIDLVCNAIKALKQRGGASRISIKKYLEENQDSVNQVALKGA